MGLSRNKVAVSEGAAGSPPFYGERVTDLKVLLRKFKITNDLTREVKWSVVQFSMTKGLLRIVGVTNAEGPPVPIPNTEVKLCSGDNTLRETVREDSSMPTQGKGTDKTVPKS